MKTPIYPKWSQLPDIDLYLDQVLLYVNQYKGASEDKGLTAAMINNYVKHGHISKPVKKKYSRHQLARLIVITAFKNIFSIQDISHTLSVLTSKTSASELYDAFVACMNGDEPDDLAEVVRLACQTLKLYQETQQQVQALKEENAHV